jgi:hypothetical protein
MGGTQRPVRDPRRLHEVTEATPLMAAYFFGALRDQSSRATVFQRQMRWQRLRVAGAAEERDDTSVLLEDVTPTPARQAQPRAAAG